MKTILKAALVLISSLVFSGASAQYASVSKYKLNSSKSKKPIEFTEWSTLLRRNTSVLGTIDYSGFGKDQASFDRFIKKLSFTKITNNWTQSEQIAYWINVYNAFAVKLIVNNFPVKSITEIEKPFKKKFFEIDREMMSLNDVEEIIQGYGDPRALLVLNRNSKSGVRLIKKAYTAEGLDEMLDKRVRLFVNDPNKNRITDKEVKLSPLFKKFEKEISKSKGSVKAFINLYSNKAISNQKILYTGFNKKINSYQAYGE